MMRLYRTIDTVWNVCYYNSFGLGRTHDAVSSNTSHATTLSSVVDEPAVPSTLVTASAQPLVTGGQCYVGVQELSLYNQPVVSFDAVVTKLSYGSAVTVRSLRGRWACVVSGAYEGWALKDALYADVSVVRPKLHINQMYAADDINTIQVRACIDDDFGAGHADLPLTGAEFVAYSLWSQDISVPWAERRTARTPGTWQRHLRGKPGVHIAITPSQGSIMEYIIDDIGYVAYVSEVFDDDSIRVAQVGRLIDGQYTEYMLPKDEYRELKPVFINVVA